MRKVSSFRVCNQPDLRVGLQKGLEAVTIIASVQRSIRQATNVSQQRISLFYRTRVDFSADDSFSILVLLLRIMLPLPVCLVVITVVLRLQ
ncbi:hypothetical protein D8B24_20795 [Verminephrobacter aporrectodeae subsp. tuberculatae]|nr:hypothetical protein [Verminephrobacter aporrectodeae subsp. tuberculatae]